MWFDRKAKNRRLRRNQVLEVKLRSDQVRARRLRWLGLAVGSLAGVLLTALVLWRSGQWVLDRMLFANPAFALRQVEVETDGVLRPDLLRRWAGVQPGQNLLALDLARVRRDLELCSSIRTAVVERELPGRLRIRVFERRPIARVHGLARGPDGRGIRPVIHWIDAEGYVIAPLDPRLRAQPEEEQELPLLVGVAQSDLVTGRRAESPALRAALKLLQEFDRSPMVGLVSLRQIDVSSPTVIHVVTGQGSEVTFALDQLDRQMHRWRAVHDYGRQQQKVIATLDLSVGDNTPARWIDELGVQPPAPKARAKAAPATRKRNA
jgi:cell division septal protein FtsQ